MVEPVQVLTPRRPGTTQRTAATGLGDAGGHAGQRSGFTLGVTAAGGSSRHRVAGPARVTPMSGRVTVATLNPC